METGRGWDGNGNYQWKMPDEGYYANFYSLDQASLQNFWTVRLELSNRAVAVH